MFKVCYEHYLVPQFGERWHALRLNRVTASVAPACLGMSPWCSPQKAYRQIIGIESSASNWMMEHGREFEPVCAHAYEVEFGFVCVDAGFWVCSRWPGIGASPDRLVGFDGLLECKVSQKVNESLPLHWRIQALVQLACTGRKWCDVCQWWNGVIKVWRVLPSGIEGIMRRLEDFRCKYVRLQRQPKRGEVLKWKPCVR